MAEPLDFTDELRADARALTGHPYTSDLLDRAATEIERLRAALQEIADDPGGYPGEDAFEQVREVAIKALNANAPRPPE